jgi:hypothetical protein
MQLTRPMHPHTVLTVLISMHSGQYDPAMDFPPSVFALICPVCGGQIEKVGERRSRSLFACLECDCDVIVPTSAWDVARIKREQRWQAKRAAPNPLSRVLTLGRSLAAGRGTPEK